MFPPRFTLPQVVQMPTHAPRLALFYQDAMVPPDDAQNYSKSPTKPRRFLDFLRHGPLWPHVELREDFEPVTRADLLLAHTPGYVDAFLQGQAPLCQANGLAWSPAFRDTVLRTQGCLLAALRTALADPGQVTMAPVSGFHHARPRGGSGFCTFSGQVIAGLCVYRESGRVGAWIDLDGHFGNSIEDTRAFAPDLDLAIPPGCNVNPEGVHGAYLRDLTTQLEHVGREVLAGRVHYLCVAHGADSHEGDQLGHQCTTEEWLAAADLVYGAVAHWSRELARPVPVTLTLFGGYRDDDPDSVLALHAMDTARCLAHLGGIEAVHAYRAEVRPPQGRDARAHA
jgi:acetoin utilization deacetylase AcuC-like enzyme